MSIIRWIIAAPFVVVFLALTIVSTFFSVALGLILYVILGEKIISAMDKENINMQIPL